MASQAGVEPGDMANTVASAQAGMEQAVMKHLSTFGVYDRDTFTAFLHSSPQNHQRMVESVRDLVMHNSTKGFEAFLGDTEEGLGGAPRSAAFISAMNSASTLA